MSKTTLRGFWPGKPVTINPDKMTVIEKPYTPPDRHAHVRGKSKYKQIILDLLAKPPGSAAAFCPTRKEGRALVHGIVRHLEQNGLDKKLRPAAKTSGDAAEVWIIKRDA